MTEVLVATRDVVGRRMAGPGIRAFHLARELSRHLPTTLIASLEDYGAKEQFGVLEHGSPKARDAMRSARVIIGQPTRELISASRWVRAIYDLFDPAILELAELERASTLRAKAQIHVERGRLVRALREGAALISAGQRQRDFYLGVHAASGGDARGWNDRWIDLPFGLPDENPADEPPADLGGSIPAVMWGGGAWDWLDPATAVEAVERLNARGVSCRLFFLGAGRPNKKVPPHGAETIRRLAERSEYVKWNAEWVPYEERARWIRGAALSVMLHRPTAEAEMSVRTRFFDALWCLQPAVATEGGLVSDLIARETLGVVVPAQDPEAVARGIQRLLQDDEFRARCVENLRRVRERYRWSVVARPLVERARQFV